MVECSCGESVVVGHDAVVDDACATVIGHGCAVAFHVYKAAIETIRYGIGVACSPGDYGIATDAGG